MGTWSSAATCSPTRVRRATRPDPTCTSRCARPGATWIPARSWRTAASRLPDRQPTGLGVGAKDHRVALTGPVDEVARDLQLRQDAPHAPHVVADLLWKQGRV